MSLLCHACLAGLLAVPFAPDLPQDDPPATGAATRPATAPSTQPRRDLVIPEKDVHIPRAFLDEIEQAAILAETAKLNELDWESYYRAYLGLQRADGQWNRAEVDTIGLYFGAMQQMHSPELAKKKLTADEVDALKAKLAGETKALRDKTLELRRAAKSKSE
jgi:hypothetical protein